nr:hypothetical protein [uncultured Sphaerochaeta sp.]
MEYLRNRVPTNGSVNLWWTSSVKKTALTSKKTTFQEPVNLTEAYVQIVYPVRKEFLTGHRLEGVPYPEGPFTNLHFPFENNRLDFSSFIHTPHHLSVSAKTWIEVEEDGVYPFELYTCGAMKLWIDGEQAAIFSPFTRNIAQKREMTFTLEAGLHEVVVYAEELAERDVFFYIELRYKGELPLVNSVEVAHDPEELTRGMELLKSLHFEKDFYEEGDIRLLYDATLIKKPVTLSVLPEGQALTLQNDGDSVHLWNTEAHGIEVNRVTFSLPVGPYELKRDLLVGIAEQSKTHLKWSPSIRERKIQALHAIKELGDLSITRALVLCETEGILNEEALAMVERSITTIEQKEDCSDFHLVPLFFLITRYRYLLSPALLSRIEKALLSYRYWMDEPGNDVMWFFSENHAFLFHIGQYLAGYLYPEETFQTSGRNGLKQYEIGKERLIQWFTTFFTYGFAEWNSATYLPIDFIGFFTLHALAPDTEIQAMAKRSLDFTFHLIAHNTYQGVMSSSFGRCYEDTLKFRSLSEISFLSLVAFGKGYRTAQTRSVALFALSSYEPPSFDNEVELAERQWMEIMLKQGVSGVNTYLFKTRHYQMGCVQQFRPFEHGHQQHLFNVALGKVQYFINHPGEPAFSGQNRPSYWAGNGTMPAIYQYRNIALLLFSIDEQELVHAIHSYAPLERMDAYRITNHHFYFACDGGYVSTYFSNPFSLTREGANTNREIISPGLVHAVVVRCSNVDEFSSFEAFVSDQEQQHYTFDREALSLSVTDSSWGLVRAVNSHFTVQGREIITDYPRDVAIQKGVFYP